MRILILAMLLTVGFGQVSHKALLDKIAFLEKQIGQSYVAPAVSEAVFTELQALIDEADNLYYKGTRMECVEHIKSIVADTKAENYASAIKTIDYLVLNRDIYFYKGYAGRKRAATVERFEGIKSQLGVVE